MQKLIEQARAYWAQVAKDNGWYCEPFYVQVWFTNDMKEITNSVSFKDMTGDIILQANN